MIDLYGRFTHICNTAFEKNLPKITYWKVSWKKLKSAGLVPLNVEIRGIFNECSPKVVIVLTQISN
jgi:hypothetical protein